MNLFDAVVTAAVVLGAVLGFMSGLVRSLATILAYFLAAPVAVAVAPFVAPLLDGKRDTAFRYGVVAVVCDFPGDWRGPRRALPPGRERNLVT